MQISFLGAARTVTGSQHLLKINNHTLLLDCGLYQGRGREAFDFNRSFDLDPQKLDAVILSHAHIDHAGNLPGLVKQGYEGRIFATPASAYLADIMLRDSAQIQEADANGKNGKKKWTPPEPLYTQEDAGRVAGHFSLAQYGQPFEPVPGVKARLLEAGHILGSAAVELEIEEKGKLHRLWFSGDIGRRNLPLIKDPVLPEGVDTLIMECTYGGSSHGDPRQVQEALAQILVRTLERGGKVIVPAFAVGRTQELVYHLHQLIERGEIPEVPVFVDSPLAVEASKVFIDFENYFDEETRNFIQESGNRRALGFDLLRYVQTVQESRALNERDEPMIIISASGMLESGRVVHHLRQNIEDERSTILIVSYQAPNTLGRALLDGEKQVEIWGDMFDCKAEVARLEGLSAHAGKRFLQEYAGAVKDCVKQVFLVHGEEKPAEILQKSLKRAGFERVYYPYLRQTIEVE